MTQEASQAYKCIFEFDTVNLLINVYRPASLGKDTNVVLGFRNIQDDVTISRDNSLVTQFYVEGLDEYYIDPANYGTNVIEDLTYVFWLAHYKSDYSYHEPPIKCDFFQYTDRGTVPGVSGKKFDTNVCFSKKYLS